MDVQRDEDRHMTRNVNTNGGIFKGMRIPALVSFLILLLIPCVSADYTTMANSIMFKTTAGLLLPLGIENWVSAADTIMYYNWIAMALIVTVAAFAGQSNESRFAVFVPLFTGLMVFIGWLQAPDPTNYWGMIVGCLLLGALMYLNDMNHEKYGLPGPGSKLLTVVFMIIVFEASVTLMSMQGLNLFPELGDSGLHQQSLTCGYGYQCDANGNIMLSASVSGVSNAGGANLDIISVGMWVVQAMIGVLIFLIKIVAAILLFSVVLVMAYPALAASPQAVLFLSIMQIVIWAIYSVAFFNWYFKPSFETAAV
jgi:hypothetical protein